MTDDPTPLDHPPAKARRSWMPAAVAVGGVLAMAGLFYFTYQPDAALAQQKPSERIESPAAPAPEPEPAQAKVAPAQDNDRRLAAPELEGGVEWLNSSGPIRIKDLRGKVVLLDFWTFCCINCMHVLPDLAKLEKKYPNQLVVIGVHSAKFDREKDSKNIRDAILRYNIEHPVVNDANHRIWNAYAVQSWPTFWLVDPEGYLVGRGSGEGLFEALDKAISQVIKVHREKKTLNERPVWFDLAKYKERNTNPLYFPGKVLADGKGQRLFIADSSHHRIVITDLEGRKLDVAGTGPDGKDDGPFDQATFNDPQGMALRGDTLFVADRRNHLIRALDLKAKTVRTVAGTGEQGTNRQFGGEARSTGLNSPWDLLLKDEVLYVAMAGHHQIWRLDLRTNVVEPFAGSGREDIFDGVRARSMFAQPSGLASDGDWLYVADSEVSAVRAVSLKPDETVKTLVGEGLFEFADVDGPADKARLQHCLGVAYHGGKVYVADTYNNKVKVIDPAKRVCETFLGDGKPGRDDRPARFDEPGGLSVLGDQLYVADTNNHLIRVVDLKTKQVQTLKLKGVEPPKPPSSAVRPIFPNPVTTRLAEAAIPRDGDVTLEVTLDLPPRTKLNPEAPVQYLVEAVSSGGTPYERSGTIEKPRAAFDIKVPAEKLGAAKTLKISVVYYPCQDGSEGICQVKSHVWEIPIRSDVAGKDRTIQLATTSVSKADTHKALR